jgi:hypothetical protein
VALWAAPRRRPLARCLFGFGKKDPNAQAAKEAKEKARAEAEAARAKKHAKLKEDLRRGYFYELGQVNKTTKVRGIVLWCTTRVCNTKAFLCIFIGQRQ